MELLLKELTIDEIRALPDSQLTMFWRKLKLLDDSLIRVKEILREGSEIIVHFESNGTEPYKDCRLYSPQGKAIGFGKLLINDSKILGSLFENKTFKTYRVSIDIAGLLNKDISNVKEKNNG